MGIQRSQGSKASDGTWVEHVIHLAGDYREFGPTSTIYIVNMPHKCMLTQIQLEKVSVHVWTAVAKSLPRKLWMPVRWAFVAPGCEINAAENRTTCAHMHCILFIHALHTVHACIAYWAHMYAWNKICLLIRSHASYVQAKWTRIGEVVTKSNIICRSAPLNTKT